MKNEYELKMQCLARYYLRYEFEPIVKNKAAIVNAINSFHAKQVKLNGKVRGDAAFEELRKYLKLENDKNRKTKC